MKKRYINHSYRDRNRIKYSFLFIIIGLLTAVDLLLFGVSLFNDNYKRNIINDVKTSRYILDDNFVFLGDSITAGYNLDEFFENYPVINSGVSGNMSGHLLERLDDDVYKYNPSKVFILIGINDIIYGGKDYKTINNIKKIVNNIKKNRPHAKIYIESIYPINSSDDSKISADLRNSDYNKKIIALNKDLKKYCEEKQITYIDLHSKLKDKNGNLYLKYTKEGLHISDAGYEKISQVLEKYLQE